MKNNMTLMILLILSLPAIGQVPTNGLVGHWPFNGNANDASGNGNNGTVSVAALTSDRFGNANSAYSFNGIDSYIEMPDNAVLRSNEMTISIWVNSNFVFLPRAQAILVKCNYSNAQNEQYAIIIRPNGTYNYPEFAAKFNSFCQPGAGWSNCANQNTASTINNWHHIVGIFNGDSLILYHDNVLSAIVLKTGDIDDCAGGTLNIGRSWNQFPDYFQGALDDIRIYNRPLSGSEVTELFNEGNLVGFNPVSPEYNIKIHATPSSGHIMIDCGSNYSALNGFNFKIINSAGRLVFQSPVTQQKEMVDVSSWAAKGIHFVHLTDGSGNRLM